MRRPPVPRRIDYAHATGQNATHVLSLTLDTSCVLNFLGEDETCDDALIQLVALAMDGLVSLKVTEAAYAEIEGASDAARRRELLKRIQVFGHVALPEHQRDEQATLRDQLYAQLFPRAQSGSRTSEHNVRDCGQLATHQLIGRDVFVTLDDKLQRRVARSMQTTVTALNPEAALRTLNEQSSGPALAVVEVVSVRDAAVDQDEASIREVLAPLAADYPDFNGWLTRSLAEAKAGKTRIRVGEAGGRVGAVAISKAKDPRVQKLAAFYVADWAREQGLGQHLLWSEVRTWAQSSIDKVYVTVSSRHADLIEFFQRFGFLVEGLSPRRYQDNTTELVLGRHLLRKVLASDDQLAEFASEAAQHVFAPPTSATLTSTSWALAPPTERPRYAWHGTGANSRLVESVGSAETREWDLLDLERTFYPARFAVPGRQALIVPIQQTWADAMIGYEPAQPSLLADVEGPGKLLLRTDNAYYCFPTALQTARTGTPIIFMVTGGTGLVGEAKILEASVEFPEDLYLRFRGIGVYALDQIRAHVQKKGPNRGRALALRFGLYEPYSRPVPRSELVAVLGRNLQVQTITPIRIEEFETLRRIGGLEW